MKKLLLILVLFSCTKSYSQIRVVLKSNRLVTSNRIEFTKDAVLLDEYHKINSKIFEMDKSLIKSIIAPNGRIINFLYLISNEKDIEDFKKSYVESKPTLIDSTKKQITVLDISKDSLDNLMKVKLSLAQKDEKVFVEEVVFLKDSDKKNKIFVSTKEWISKSFKSSKSVIDYEAKEEGKIICKGFYKSGRYGLDELEMFYTLDFTIKDGKYRIQIYNLEMKENHYDIMGMKLNPYLPFTTIDIDKMNYQFASNDPKPFYRKKYSEEIISRTDYVLTAFINSAKTYIQNNSQKNDSDF